MSGTDRPRAQARAGRTGRSVLLVQVAAGPVAGLAWWLLTRDPPAWLGGEPVLTRGSLDAARDGTLAVLGAVLGAAAGLRVLRRPGQRPGRTLLAAVVGALIGPALAVGVAAVLPAGLGGRVVPRAWGTVLLWPTALLGVVFVRSLAAALAERRPPADADPGDAVSRG